MLLMAVLYKLPAIFHLFGKVPQVKNRLFPKKPLPLCKPLGFVQLDEKVDHLRNTFG